MIDNTKSTRENARHEIVEKLQKEQDHQNLIRVFLYLIEALPLEKVDKNVEKKLLKLFNKPSFNPDFDYTIVDRAVLVINYCTTVVSRQNFIIMQGAYASLNLDERLALEILSQDSVSDKNLQEDYFSHKPKTYARTLIYQLRTKLDLQNRYQLIKWYLTYKENNKD